MTETERELDLALGNANAEITTLQAKNERLLRLVEQFAQRLLKIEQMANVALHKAHTVADESSDETD